MKKLLILLTATILVSSIATVVVAVSNGPAEIKFTPKMGTVTFDHTAHQSLTDCSTCHHTGEYAQCKSCHDIDPKAPKAKDAYHKLCKDCHKEMAKGPTKCKECHIK
ncbi:MAG: cytochrome c3 family protein [Desulfuromusa sp.]|nr:cytochrome c3 family protein [Desulfuromusa sp.]